MLSADLSECNVEKVIDLLTRRYFLKKTLATSFTQCNAKLIGNKQCLKETLTGFCDLHHSDDNAELLRVNISLNNYPMVKHWLKTLSISNYDIMKCYYNINMNTLKPIVDLIYFCSNYQQGLYITGRSIYDRLSPKTLLFMYEKIFLTNCLLDQYKDRGLFDIKTRLLSTKIDEEHFDLLHNIIYC